MIDNKLLFVVSAIFLIGCDGTSIDDSSDSTSTLSERKTGSTVINTKPESSSNPNSISNVTPSGFGNGLNGNNSRSIELMGTEQLEEQAIYGQDPKSRILALQNLVEKASEESALPVVEQALNDADKEVRKETLTLIYKKRLPISDEVLHEVAVKDSSENVRGMAWVNIVDREGPDLRKYLNDALNDPSEGIRRDAQLRLNELDRQGR